MFDILGGIAGSLLGGLFGDERDEDARTLAREQTVSSQAFSDKQFAEQMAFQREQLARNEMQAERQQLRNNELQREFATHGIQWKMADAAAAGLHPVYGAGLSGAAYASNPVVINPVVSPGGSSASVAPPSYTRSHVDYGAMGQGIGRLIEKLLVKDTVKDAALAAAVDSNAAVTTQAAQSMGIVSPASLGANIGDEMEWAPRVFVPPSTVNALDTTVYEPARSTSTNSGDDSRVAGRPEPAMRTWKWGPDFEIILPAGNSFSESLEAIGEAPWMLPFFVQRNIEAYGPQWLWKAAKQNIITAHQVRLLEASGELGRQSLEILKDAVFGSTQPNRGPSVRGRIRPAN